MGFLIVLSACHASTLAVEASTSAVPMVVPAGTVLRVRLNQTLDSGRNRAGDRFTGVLDTPVMAGTMELLPKGTVVEGHVLCAWDSGRVRGSAGNGEDAMLELTLDFCEHDGRRVALTTSPVARTARVSSNQPGSNIGRREARISVPAESIMGFTLTSTLAA